MCGRSDCGFLSTSVCLSLPGPWHSVRGGNIPHISKSYNTAFKNAVSVYQILSICAQNNINLSKNKKMNVNSGYHGVNTEREASVI